MGLAQEREGSVAIERGGCVVSDNNNLTRAGNWDNWSTEITHDPREQYARDRCDAWLSVYQAAIRTALHQVALHDNVDLAALSLRARQLATDAANDAVLGQARVFEEALEAWDKRNEKF